MVTVKPDSVQSTLVMDKTFSWVQLEPKILKASLCFIPCDKYKCR